MRLAPGVIALAVLCGCGGDPRDPFLGMYEGDGVEDVSWSDGTSDRQEFHDRIYISPAADSRRLHVSELCNVSATLKDGDELRIEPVQCSPYSVDTCDVSRSVDEGMITLRGDELTLDYAGDLFVTCTDRGPFSARVATHVTAQRQ